jgi:ketosteroid isomerase-like protein
MTREMELLRRLYDRFNARDIEAVLAALHDDVQWANGWEGGYVSGHEAVRQYWVRQWESIDPRVEPVRFATGSQGEIVAEIHQIVRDRTGKLLADKVVQHVFRIEDGRIRRFDIGANTG